MSSTIAPFVVCVKRYCSTRATDIFSYDITTLVLSSRVVCIHDVLLSIGTLFVGNLSFDVDEETLKEFVTSQGHAPSAVRIITRNTGESKG